MSVLGPMILEPVLSERIWGVERLPAVYPQPEPGRPVGEVWLTSVECSVRGGNFDGAALGKIAEEHRSELQAEHGFPLLIKILAPREKLSVQVHPNDEEARHLGEPRGKTECWYVLEAESGAQVAAGLRAGVEIEDLRRSIADGTAENLLRMLPVKVGDMVFVDAGTVHAIGPGVLLLETQQYSDMTYRLYDYGRPRELHVEPGLAVSKLVTAAGLVLPQQCDGYVRLIDCAYFAVDRFELEHGSECRLGEERSLQILIPLGEGVELESEGEVALPLPPGKAVVLPAEGRQYRLRAGRAASVMRIVNP